MTNRPCSPFTRPAVFLLNRIGDQLIALPAMRALGAMFPAGLQLLMGEGMLSFVYRGLPVGDTVRVWWDDYERETIDAARTARSALRCDLFVCLSRHLVPSVAELARRMNATWSVGFCEHLDQPVRFEDNSHMFDNLFALPQLLEPSLRLDRFNAPPTFSGAAEAAAARYAAVNFRREARVLFLHPETRPEKTWAPERFAWVVERFLAERPDYRVIVSSLEPIDLGAHGGRVIYTDAHLELAFALMRHVDLFLGVDSCFLHAADLFRVPGVALFGPTAARHWGFRFSPCSRHVTGASMDDIAPAPVLEALLDVAQRADTVTREERPPLAS
jgi:ADP-heptose:LPS heptosyltransferase